MQPFNYKDHENNMTQIISNYNINFKEEPHFNKNPELANIIQNKNIDSMTSMELESLHSKIIPICYIKSNLLEYELYYDVLNPVKMNIKLFIKNTTDILNKYTSHIKTHYLDDTEWILKRDTKKITFKNTIEKYIYDKSKKTTNFLTNLLNRINNISINWKAKYVYKKINRIVVIKMICKKKT